MTDPQNLPPHPLQYYREKILLAEDQAVLPKNSSLQGITIALAVTGGIGSIESPKVIRELRRLGAEVAVYATSHALKFVTPLSLEWASGREVVTTLTATAEQIMKEDILLISPATANIIAKAAVGIADETVSTLIAGALGKRKFILEQGEGKIPPTLLILPTMHSFLSAHPQFDPHIKFLVDHGFTFIEPRRNQGENKLKMPSPEDVAVTVAHAFYRNIYQHQKAVGKFNPFTDEVLITAGATSEPLDGVRLLTNRGSGDTGIILSQYLHTLGIKVRLFVSDSRKKDLPPYLNQVSFFEDYSTYEREVFRILKECPVKVGIFTAAVSDFKPQSFQEEKMETEKMSVQLLPQTKVIAQVRKAHPELTMVVFKYTVGKSVDEIAKAAQKMLQEYDFVAANRKEDIGSEKKIRYFFNNNTSQPRITYNDIELAEGIAEGLLGS